MEKRVKFNGKPNEERIRFVAKQLLKEILDKKTEDNHEQSL